MNWAKTRVAYISLVTIVTLGVTLLSRDFAILLAIVPTAYFLSVHPDNDTTAVGIFASQLLATTAGLVAYFMFASGIDPLAVGPRSQEVFRLVLSVLSAIVVTGIGLHLVDAKLSTAHVTASIVALGVITTPLGLGMLIVWITLISGIHGTFSRTGNLSQS